MALQGVRVAEVDGVHLGRVLGGILDVVAEKLAQSAELGLAGVLQAELERLQSGGLVHDLEARIVLEDLEHRPVGLPQELEPRSDDRTISTIPGLLTRDSGKEDSLGGLDGLEVLNVGRRSRGLQRGLDLVGLGLGLRNLLLRELDELLENRLSNIISSASIHRI